MYSYAKAKLLALRTQVEASKYLLATKIALKMYKKQTGN